MGRSCYFNCIDAKRLYGFPKDPEERMAWCNIVGADFARVRPNTKLCEKHFDPKYLGVKNLKRYLVPPVIAPQQNENNQTLPKNDEIQSLPKNEEIQSLPKNEEIQSLPKIKDPQHKENNQPHPKNEEIQSLQSNTSFSEGEDTINFPNKPLKTCGSIIPLKKRKIAESKNVTSCCSCDCHKKPDTSPQKLEKGKLQTEAGSLEKLISEHKKQMEIAGKDYEKLMLQNTKLNAEIESHKENIEELSKIIFGLSTDIESKAPKFARMICGKTNRYSTDQLDIAQSIHHVSPKCYRFMKEDLSFHLPSPSTLLKLRPPSSIETGIENNAEVHQKEVAASFNKEEQQCEMIFGEMDCQPSLECDISHDIKIEL
ncbi:uncharacterized protein LOC106091677 isoform X1 [Stomoxys calcitrans]|uniref:uncharacterized protein LOC106091677 isoform X1 n=1 Tax=Stomoxys calcitrans TaxID=35570 RepID=UPI0027E3682A|nr:uncharacterized protein LOC106091677 isoform X1 [Stomoxys calcitrans]